MEAAYLKKDIKKMSS